MKNISGPLINLIYPRRCPICDEPVPVRILPRPSAPLICPECESKIVRIREPVCLKCGKRLHDAGGTFCADCSREEHVYEAGCAAFEYRSVSGALYRLKYEGRAEYAEYFGREMAISIMRRFQRAYPPSLEASMTEPIGAYPPSPETSMTETTGAYLPSQGRERKQAPLLSFDALIPVPVSEERLLQRGYNQAALLARSISRYLHIPVEEHILSRCHNTAAMKRMSAAARRRNLKNAFLVSVHDVKLSRVMLIDDIYTTGATIDTCAELLLQAGAGSVCFAVAAIGEDSR